MARTLCLALAIAALAASLCRLAAQEPATTEAKVGAAPAAAPTPRPSAQLPTEPQDAAAAANRLREGTRLKDRLGKFRQNGESITFVDEDGREMGGLPNLSLERITRMLKTVEEPEGVWWSVSGVVTEFSGRNYLLISRAVYKSATLPPAPNSLD
jgi:hypothetical protein